jgi:hypothetical protein
MGWPDWQHPTCKGAKARHSALRTYMAVHVPPRAPHGNCAGFRNSRREFCAGSAARGDANWFRKSTNVPTSAGSGLGSPSVGAGRPLRPFSTSGWRAGQGAAKTHKADRLHVISLFPPLSTLLQLWAFFAREPEVCLRSNGRRPPAHRSRRPVVGQLSAVGLTCRLLCGLLANTPSL